MIVNILRVSFCTLCCGATRYASLIFCKSAQQPPKILMEIAGCIHVIQVMTKFKQSYQTQNLLPWAAGAVLVSKLMLKDFYQQL